MAKLPITLEAGTADGILVKTDSIKDETQNKFQHNINAEVIADIETLDENTFKKSGGTINGNVSVYNSETFDGTTTSTFVKMDAYGMEVTDSSTGNASFVTPEQIVSKKISIIDGTSDVVLLADGTTAEIMKDTDVENAIAAAWGS